METIVIGEREDFGYPILSKESGYQCGWVYREFPKEEVKVMLYSSHLTVKDLQKVLSFIEEHK